MPYKNTLEALYIQLNEVQQNIATWGTENSIRNIDIDLALSKIRDIYDLILELKQLEKLDPKVIIEQKTEKAESRTIELEVEDSGGPENSIYELNTKVDNETISPEPAKPEAKADRVTQDIKTNSQEKSSLGERFYTEKPTLNEELSTQVSSSDLANQLKNRPITNLSSAIGLNEKFELINTLFHGDKDKYEATIEKLNVATNFNEAYNYLSSMLNWDMSDPMVQRILELIRRKLIVKKA
jgi:hypothetical protein